MVHIDWIDIYVKQIIQHNTVVHITLKGVILNLMKMLNTFMGWFEITQVPLFGINKITSGNNEYINKSSTRVR